MASIFDKMNARLPALLRPGSRLRTKAASIKPLIALKKFALKTVMAAKKLRLLVPRRASNFAKDLHTPHTSLRSKLGADVDTALHSRSIKQADPKDILEQFRLKGEKYGTEAAKQEATDLLAAFEKLKPALEKFVEGADVRADRQREAIAKLENKFTDGLAKLKDIAWADMDAFLDSKSSGEVIEYQSLHQLIYGTSHVKTGTGERLPGLKHFVQSVKADPSQRKPVELPNGESGMESEFDAALRLMKEEWIPHGDSVNEQLGRWEDEKHTSSARDHQHYFAFLRSLERLGMMTMDPDKSTALDAKQKFLGQYGELFGIGDSIFAASGGRRRLRHRSATASQEVQKNVQNEVDSGLSSEDEYLTTQTQSGSETDYESAKEIDEKGSGLRRRKLRTKGDRDKSYNSGKQLPKDK
ncbi:hypothetical protein [Endozoicomonas euniceicola]|uniref:Uncharacterized protein n=1 Tax=Endozoicomonas euniceicola TaxID=1234143 RepID=A0ABY6GW39_9GAMM|nr:hypothetical protein [Endozoicomonas euniceicola]UYM16979.1 hypothetical protein NX720_03375 [Endozoicomonas euniceicola]